MSPVGLQKIHCAYRISVRWLELGGSASQACRAFTARARANAFNIARDIELT